MPRAIRPSFWRAISNRTRGSLPRVDRWLPKLFNHCYLSDLAFTLTTVLDLGNQTSGSRTTTPPFWIKNHIVLLMGLFCVAVISVVVLSGARYLHDFVTGRVDPAVQNEGLSAQPADDGVVEPVSLPSSTMTGTRLFDAPVSELTGQFTRTWRISGPQMCAAFRDAGIEATEWRAASMRSVTYECYFQRIYERDEIRPLRSTFLRVRGNAWGEVIEISGRIVGPTTDDQGSLDPSLMRIFEVLVSQVKWGDFQDTLGPIQKLLDVRCERFGASFEFTRELSQDNSYNFTLVLSQGSNQQVRTRAYFSQDRWMANPDYRRTRPVLPMLSSR